METRSKLSPLKRVHFYTGKILTAADFEAEQEYYREIRRRHNRYFHGCGVVIGMEVAMENNMVRVAPGFALDCSGEEIEIQEAVLFPPPEDARAAFLRIAYAEEKTDPEPAAGENAGNDVHYSRILGSFELSYELDDPYAGHTGDQSLWHPCGSPHPIPIGKLVLRWGNWEVDPWFVPPGASQ